MGEATKTIWIIEYRDGTYSRPSRGDAYETLDAAEDALRADGFTRDEDNATNWTTTKDWHKFARAYEVPLHAEAKARPGK